jgi:hypothetical protein
MSDHVLKASVRQTLAYIEAYDADLLRAIEASFKEALLNCNGEDEDEDEDEDENIATKVQAAPASSEAPAAPPPDPQPRPIVKPTKTPNVATSATVELLELPVWHYQLPLIATFLITTLLFIFAR